jgi:iron complex transport system ATP-binding protein
MNLLRTSQLAINIGGKTVCRNLNLALEPGQIWGLLGRNGAGKTTLLHTLAGLRAAASGDIFLREQNLEQLSRKHIAQHLGLLLQHHDDSFPASVLETVLSGRHPHIGDWQWENEADVDIAREALRRVELLDLQTRSVQQLSGGERQRVAMAMLLAQNPEIFLLDEPNSHLDLNYQIRLLDLFCTHARDSGRTIVMSLHDINLAARFCDHIILLADTGEAVTGSADTLLNPQQLSDIFHHPIALHELDGRKFFSPV